MAASKPHTCMLFSFKLHMSQPGSTCLASSMLLLQFCLQPRLQVPKPCSPLIPWTSNHLHLTVCSIKSQTQSKTITSMTTGPAFPHIPSVPRVSSQAAPTLQISSPSTTSQEMMTSSENVQEVKPFVSGCNQVYQS